MNNARLVQITPNPEQNIAYIARVSNPNNQENPSFEGLLKYCIKEGHWSIFEQAYMTLEINTSLAIATQILRHRSFCFQQFSQRYADSTLLQDEIPVPRLRKQDTKNRQNSTDTLDEGLRSSLEYQISLLFAQSLKLYSTMLECGVAKECARMVLPQATQTRLYMTGNCRSWIHYIRLRAGNGTQKEHMDVANSCKTIFIEQFPTVAKALEWHLPSCNETDFAFCKCIAEGELS